MSVLLAVATANHTALCTDCQHTNMKTKKKVDVDAPKIDTFLGKYGIAHCGSAYAAQICMKTLKFLTVKHELTFSSMEDIAEMVQEIYSGFIETNMDIEEQCSSVFVVAGLLRNGHPGLGLISNDGGVKCECIDGMENSHIQVFPPVDLSHAECVKIVNQSVTMIQCLAAKQWMPDSLRLEKVLRESVRRIASHSQYVSQQSMFWIYPHH